VDPIPDPLLLRKSGRAGNRTQTSGSVARNSAHSTTEVKIEQATTMNFISHVGWLLAFYLPYCLPDIVSFFQNIFALSRKRSLVKVLNYMYIA
jgi:hypothetical protein